MKHQERGLVVAHKHPVWRDRATSVFHMLAGVHGGRSRWEQLWWRRTARGRFTLCCIPFLIDDLALGDEVETNACHIVRRIARRSGQVTFRVRIGGHEPGMRDQVLKASEVFEPLAEWSAPNLLALSVHESRARPLGDRLAILAGQKMIEVDTGRIADGHRSPVQR
ncbi:DUF4265 domain-containing protein [Luteibacter aegosomatis]|uniref:DUF4265 domain-containing protein n=1 Tax=Luteibacter aegosomatis TaxID=2911537 RepID=UPI001FF77516|nr:DUF4265 domain-containing protein [Luteibacter aegosomatis]UPG83993.1 DUF4265 domain-containing protein [Luteibacter aegosomatis]